MLWWLRCALFGCLGWFVGGRVAVGDCVWVGSGFGRQCLPIGVCLMSEVIIVLLYVFVNWVSM